MSVRRLTVLTLVLAVVLAVLAPVPALAKSYGDPGVVPPLLARLLTGKTYADWADAWTEWQGSIPAEVHPSHDTTGVLAGVGQVPSSRVFFLTSFATVTPGPIWTVERSITVAACQFIFVPVANIANLWCPTWPGCSVPTFEDYLACYRQLITDSADSFTGLHASIDGKSIRDWSPYRAHSEDDFWMYLPPSNVWNTTAGLAGPSYQDGYYLLLYPLSPGVHTINFGCTLAGWGTWDVTDHITVVP